MPGSLGSARYQEMTERLIAARTDAGMTQAQVADRLGKPQSFVAKYEGGERRLDVVEFVDICKVLGIAPSHVVKDF
nr:MULTISPECIES: helix-turn-helix transcriptional regulator [unclassified Roseitalea]